MQSGYHVEMAPGIEQAENAAEKLVQTDILVFGPKEFDEYYLGYLKNPDNRKIRSGGSSETTLADTLGQEVVGEFNAMSCTLLLAFNEAGEAHIMHWPLSSNINFWGKFPQYVEEQVTKMKQFVEATDGKFLVTGMNTSGKERTRVLKALKLNNDPETIKIFSSTEDSEREDVGVGVKENAIEGVCFIPKDLSKDGRNKIILISRRVDKDGIDKGIDQNESYKL